MEKMKSLGRLALAAGVAALLAAMLGLCACSSSSSSDSSASDQQAEEQAEQQQVEPVYVLTKATYVSGDTSTVSAAVVDEAGNVTSETYEASGFADSDDLAYETTYEYDEQGALVASESDGVRTEFEATLDDEGRLVSLISDYSESDGGYEAFEYTYGNEGKIASKSASYGYSSEDIYAEVKTEYDEYGWVSGALIDETYDDGEEMTTDLAYTFEGDDPQHPVRAVQSADEGEGGVAYVLSYDENGNLVKWAQEGYEDEYYCEFEWQKVDFPSAVIAALVPQNMIGSSSVVMFF